MHRISISKIKSAVDSISGRLILIISAGFCLLLISHFLTVHSLQKLYVYEAEVSRAKHIAGYVSLFEDLNKEDRAKILERLNSRHLKGVQEEFFSLSESGPDWNNPRATVRRQVSALNNILEQTEHTSWNIRARTIDHDSHLFKIHLPGTEFAIQLRDGSWLRATVPTSIDDRKIVWGERAVMLLEGIILLFLTVFFVRKLTNPISQLNRAIVKFGEFPDKSAPFPIQGAPEIRKVAKSLNKMRDQIQGRLQERNRLVSALAHDLRTPLTRLQLRLEKIDSNELKSQLTKDIKIISDMLNQGLEFARSLESSEETVKTDLRAVVESTAYDYMDVGYPVRLNSSPHSSEEKLIVSLKPLCFRRCLENLIENACKYGDSACISLYKEERDIVIKVSDDGPGIPADLLEKVFEPYFRVDNSRNSGIKGNGLGLSIARNMAYLNKATLTLRNRPEGGLEAELRLDCV